MDQITGKTIDSVIIDDWGNITPEMIEALTELNPELVVLGIDFSTAEDLSIVIEGKVIDRIINVRKVEEIRRVETIKGYHLAPALPTKAHAHPNSPRKSERNRKGKRR